MMMTTLSIVTLISGWPTGQEISMFIGSPVTMNAMNAQWYFSPQSNTSVPAAALYPRVPATLTTVNFTTYHQISSNYPTGGEWTHDREAALSQFANAYADYASTTSFGIGSDGLLASELVRYANGAQSYEFTSSVVDDVTPDCSNYGKFGGEYEYDTRGTSLYCFYHQTSYGSEQCTVGVQGQQTPNVWAPLMEIMQTSYLERYRIADLWRNPTQRTGAYQSYFETQTVELPVPMSNGTGASLTIHQHYSASSGFLITTGHNCDIYTDWFVLELNKIIKAQSSNPAYVGSVTYGEHTIFLGGSTPTGGAFGVPPTNLSWWSGSEGTGYYTVGPVGYAESLTFAPLHDHVLVVEHGVTPPQNVINGVNYDSGEINTAQTLNTTFGCVTPVRTGVALTVTIGNTSTVGYVAACPGSSEYILEATWEVSVLQESDGSELARAVAAVNADWTVDAVYNVQLSYETQYCDANANVSTNCASNKSPYVYSPLNLCLKTGPGVVENGTIGLGSCSSQGVVAVTANVPQVTTIYETDDPYVYWSFGELNVGFQLCGQRAITFLDPCSTSGPSGNIRAAISTPTSNLTNADEITLKDKNGNIQSGGFIYLDHTRNTTFILQNGVAQSYANVSLYGLVGWTTIPPTIGASFARTNTSWSNATCFPYNGTGWATGGSCNIVWISGSARIQTPPADVMTLVLGNHGLTFTFSCNSSGCTFSAGTQVTHISSATMVPALDAVIPGDASPLGVLNTFSELLSDLVSTSNTIAFGAETGILDTATALQNIESQFLLGQSQALAENDAQLAQVYQNRADINNLQVLMQYTQLTLVLALGLNESMLVTPQGQPLNGSLQNCSTGVPGYSGANTTAATCLSPDGDVPCFGGMMCTLYDISFNTDCIPFGVPYTGGTPAGSTALGECLYDAQVTGMYLENLMIGTLEAQQAAQAVNSSINAAIAFANQLTQTTDADFQTIALVTADLYNQLNEYGRALAATQNQTYANGNGLGSLGGFFSGTIGLGNIWHLVVEVVTLVIVICMIVIGVNFARRLWVKVESSIADHTISKITAQLSANFVTRAEFERVATFATSK